MCVCVCVCVCALGSIEIPFLFLACFVLFIICLFVVDLFVFHFLSNRQSLCYRVARCR